MSGAQPHRSCTVCAFMVDLLGSQIDAWITRTVSLPPSGRAVLGGDLNCSESRWGAADPLLCCAQSGAAAARCTAGFQSCLCPLWVIHVIPAIPACPVRPKSGHSPNARVYEYTP